MSQEATRSDRWRRTVSAGFVASVLVHVGVLGFLGLGGMVLPDTDDDRTARAEERDSSWERRAIRAVDVRMRQPAEPEAARAAPSDAAARVATETETGGAEASAAPTRLVEIRQRKAGSDVARRALARLESAGAARASDRARARREAAQPASVRPISSRTYGRESRTVFRPANDAARSAARDGDAPDFGEGTLVVDGTGRPTDWGRDDRRRGRGGVYFGGGSCSGGRGTIDRAIPDGLLVGG